MVSTPGFDIADICSDTAFKTQQCVKSESIPLSINVAIRSCAEILHLAVKRIPNLGQRNIWEAAPIECIIVRSAREPQMADEPLSAYDRCV